MGMYDDCAAKVEVQSEKHLDTVWNRLVRLRDRLDKVVERSRANADRLLGSMPRSTQPGSGMAGPVSDGIVEALGLLVSQLDLRVDEIIAEISRVSEV